MHSRPEKREHPHVLIFKLTREKTEKSIRLEIMSSFPFMFTKQV